MYFTFYAFLCLRLEKFVFYKKLAEQIFFLSASFKKENYPGAEVRPFVSLMLYAFKKIKEKDKL